MRENLYYIANIRMPTERAHGIQIMEMCQAFADQGHVVELVVPNRKTDIEDDPFKFYDVRSNFKIRKLWCLDFVRFGRLGYIIELLTFSLSVVLHALSKGGSFYTRDEFIAVFLNVMGKDVAWEAHMGQRNSAVKMLKYLKVPIVVITESLRDLYLSLGVSESLIHVAPDGADIDRFDIPVTRDEARGELGLPLDKKIVLYKGSLIPWKGAGTLAESIKFIKSKDVQIVFIGGTPEDVENFKRDFGDDERIVIKGNRPRKETPVYQKAADILVIPNSAKEDISKLYTSPMKLFGYMAGGVPIIASELPSIKEILGSQDAYFFEPDNAQSLGGAIDQVLNNYKEAQDRVTRSLAKVRVYSWKNRARDILSFIEA